MEYSIAPSEHGDYILITVRGEMTRSSAMEINVEANRLGHKLGIHHYLMDLTHAVHVDTVSNDYNFAYYDLRSEPQIDRRAHYALLVERNDHSHDFVVTVARNAGFDVHLFRDKESAIKHLTNA